MLTACASQLFRCKDCCWSTKEQIFDRVRTCCSLCAFEQPKTKEKTGKKNKYQKRRSPDRCFWSVSSSCNLFAGCLYIISDHVGNFNICPAGERAKLDAFAESINERCRSTAVGVQQVVELLTTSTILYCCCKILERRQKNGSWKIYTRYQVLGTWYVFVRERVWVLLERKLKVQRATFCILTELVAATSIHVRTRRRCWQI